MWASMHSTFNSILHIVSKDAAAHSRAALSPGQLYKKYNNTLLNMYIKNAAET